MSNATNRSIALEDYRWLVGPHAAELLNASTTLLNDDVSLVRLAQKLRSQLPAERVHLLLEQHELRKKAREKFPLAARMFFTPRGLEQATDEGVAGYKAGRFPAGQPLADLCCGVGGDLLGLGARGPVVGMDRDPTIAFLAEANLGAVLDSDARSGSRVEIRSSEEAVESLSGFAAWHIDPDRRPAGRRTTKVELHDPGPAVLERLLAACPHAAIKLAPAATLEEPWWHDAELEWISRARQCRQLVAWFGRLAKSPGQRRATVLRGAIDTPPQVVATFVGQPNVECGAAAQIGRYLFEPDVAVLAAKLEGALAAEAGLAAIAPGVAYFTANNLVATAAFDGFEVLEVLPYRIKPLRQWLAGRNIGILEVKKRGVPLDPEDVRQDLRMDGENSATILLARRAGRVTAIVARRITSRN